MPPKQGDIHRRPRSDSGAARLWVWARRRRGSWSAAEASEAASITPRRARAIILALREAGLVEMIAEAAYVGDAALYALSPAGRAIAGPPVLIVDGETGQITGVRPPGDGSGNTALEREIKRSGLSGRAAAAALGIDSRMLRRIRRRKILLSGDDPVVARAQELWGSK